MDGCLIDVRADEPAGRMRPEFSRTALTLHFAMKISRTGRSQNLGDRRVRHSGKDIRTPCLWRAPRASQIRNFKFEMRAFGATDLAPRLHPRVVTDTEIGFAHAVRRRGGSLWHDTAAQLWPDLTAFPCSKTCKRTRTSPSIHPKAPPASPIHQHTLAKEAHRLHLTAKTRPCLIHINIFECKDMFLTLELKCPSFRLCLPSFSVLSVSSVVN